MSETFQDKAVNLRLDQVQKIFGLSASEAARWHPIIKAECEKRQINTVLRYAGFFGQVGVESNNLKATSENLNYSAERLMQIFPSQFPTLEIAQQYARQPEKIANRAYALKGGNKNEASGDGYKYRGRGLIQLTLQQNYLACTRGGINCIDNPDVLLTDEGAMGSAAWYWYSKGLNAYADRMDWETCTKRVNAAKLEMDKRIALTKKAIPILLDEATDIPPEQVEIEPAKTNDINKEPTKGAPVGEVGQPGSKRNSKYPWNWVFQSRSGHIVEVDDTPGAERLMMMHRSGSFTEIDPVGTTVRKSMQDDYTIVNGTNYGMFQGDVVYKVAGDFYTRVAGNNVFNTDGRFDVQASEGIQLNTPQVCVSDELIADQGTFQKLSSVEIAELKALDAVHADLASKIGGSTGAMMGSLENSLTFSPDGNPIFTKEVAFTQPITPATYASNDGITGLPDPVANAGKLIAASDNLGKRSLLFSDGAAWVNITVPTTGGGTGGGS